MLSFILENVTILPSLLKFWFSSNNTNKMTELLNKTKKYSSLFILIKLTRKKYIYEKTFAPVLQIHKTKSIKAKNFAVMWLIFVYIFPRNLKQQLLEPVWHLRYSSTPKSHTEKEFPFTCAFPPPLSEYKAIVNVRVMLGLGLG